MATRLGIGEYQVPGSEFAGGAAQRLFLNALDVEAPQVREGLRPLVDMGATERKAAIEAWARKHGLVTDGQVPRWVRSWAQGTIPLLSVSLPGWCAMRSEWGILQPSECRIGINVEYDPLASRHQETLDRIVAAVEQQMAAIEERAKAAGAVPVDEPRQPERFGWLARYVGNEELPQDITASKRPYRAALETVKDALRDLAALLPLTLKPFPVAGQPGRPRRRPLK